MMTHKYWPCWLLAGLLLPLLPAHAADAPGKGKAADPSKAADASGAGKGKAADPRLYLVLGLYPVRPCRRRS